MIIWCNYYGEGVIFCKPDAQGVTLSRGPCALIPVTVPSEAHARSRSRQRSYTLCKIGQIRTRLAPAPGGSGARLVTPQAISGPTGGRELEVRSADGQGVWGVRPTVPRGGSCEAAGEIAVSASKRKRQPAIGCL